MWVSWEFLEGSSRRMKHFLSFSIVDVVGLAYRSSGSVVSVRRPSMR